MKNSDLKSCLTTNTNKVGKSLVLTFAFVMAFVVNSLAQDFMFIAGSVHSFSVENHEGNTFAWSYHDESFNPMPAGSIDYLEGQFETNVTVQFADQHESDARLVFLAVTETNEHGCSTTRAISIDLQPNNMYLEFASAETQECFSLGEYLAPLKVGLNFKDKAAGVEIPADRFPLQVSYEITNKTDNLAAVVGNNGAPLTLDYDADGNYYLLVTEAIGEIDRTIEYELSITSVVDKYQTVINNNDGDIRLQIRIINHLPQSGGMDMAMAYVLTPINYLGAY